MCCLHLFCMRFADQSEDGRLFLNYFLFLNTVAGGGGGLHIFKPGKNY